MTTPPSGNSLKPATSAERDSKAGGGRRATLSAKTSSVADGSSASSRTASAASHHASFGSSSGGGSDASPSMAKTASGNDRPTPSIEDMKTPIVASPQKSAPSQ